MFSSVRVGMSPTANHLRALQVFPPQESTVGNATHAFHAHATQKNRTEKKRASTRKQDARRSVLQPCPLRCVLASWTLPPKLALNELRAEMSSDLIWELVRNNSSFLVKRNGAQFSTEPGNLTNLNSFKYSGLANEKAVHIKPAKEGRGVVFAVKSAKRSNLRKPATTFTSVTLKKDFRRTARSIKGELRNYRPDLKSAALARFSRLTQSSTKVAPVVQKKRSRKNKQKK